MDRILAEPKVKATLGGHGLKTHRELLWYFAMSRRGALTAAGDAVPNTDTNLLSEVRLAALRSNPRKADNPYVLLGKNMTLDLLPFLDPDIAVDWFEVQANYYLQSKSYSRANLAGRQLMTLDLVRGRAVTYERLSRLGKPAFRLMPWIRNGRTKPICNRCLRWRMRVVRRKPGMRSHVL